MKTRLFLAILIVAVLLSLACSCPKYTWKVVGTWPADEQMMYDVCHLDKHGHCDSYWIATTIAQPGSNKQGPPVGTKCIDLGNGELDCGCKYLHLYIKVEPV